MSETADITTPLIEAIGKLPHCKVRRQHCGTVRVRGGFMHLGAAGWPDVFAIVAKRPVFFETKTPEGRLTPEQLREHKELRMAGAIVAVVRSVEEGLMVVRGILGGDYV